MIFVLFFEEIVPNRFWTWFQKLNRFCTHHRFFLCWIEFWFLHFDKWKVKILSTGLRFSLCFVRHPENIADFFILYSFVLLDFNIVTHQGWGVRKTKGFWKSEDRFNFLIYVLLPSVRALIYVYILNFYVKIRVGVL